jgi:hypothetical protein
VTRIIWSRRDLERDESSNDQTLCLPVPTSLAPGPPFDASFEQLFRDHYAALRRLLDGRSEPGLALLVVSSSGAEASGWFAAKDRVVNPLIVGRHTSAHVFLPGDRSLSLRHLALVLHRREEGGAVAFRVLDLRTALAFADEERSRLEAVEARGPVLLWCGSLGFLLFPTGAGPSAWPEDAQAAWAAVPERRYVEKTPADPGDVPAARVSVRPLEPAPADPGATTLVNTFAGPVFPSLDPEESDPPRGELLVASRSGRVAVRLGARAARRGVLLGRYERCDTSGLPVLTDLALSRVHLLVLELDGALYAIDTASRNGSWCGGERVRATPLRPGLLVSLAGKATVEWRPFH